MKLLWYTIEQKLKPYPRDDDAPVVGLDDVYEVYTVTQSDKPEHNPATQLLRRTESIDHVAKIVTRGWEVVDAPDDVFGWRSAQQFMDAFTDAELGAVDSSGNANVAGLRARLYGWRDSVRASNERIQLGLGLLVQLGILTEDRKQEILGTATPI